MYRSRRREIKALNRKVRKDVREDRKDKPGQLEMHCTGLGIDPTI
jgi:hypothetical protein